MFTCYKNYWKNYFNFSGIAKRKDMWSVLLFNCIVIFILGRISTVLSSLYSLAAFIPLMSLSVRRLHDGGHKATPLIVVYGIDFICSLFIGLNYLFSWIPVIGWITTIFLRLIPGAIIGIASIYLFILLYFQDSKINNGNNNPNYYMFDYN